MSDHSGYRYIDSHHSCAHGYLLPKVIEILESTGIDDTNRFLFDLGCGNGSVANKLTQCGWDVTGVDPSREGIQQCRLAYPGLNLHEGSAYDDLSGRFGQFPFVLSLEVVEHVYAPRDYAHTAFELCAGGGG